MTAAYTLVEGILPLRLDEELEKILHSEALQRHGHSACLLLEEGDLRLVMVALGPGTVMPDHRVEGPALVQSLRGEARLRSGDDSWALAPGILLSIPPGLDHSVETAIGCVLLVVVQSAARLSLFGPASTAPPGHAS